MGTAPERSQGWTRGQLGRGWAGVPRERKAPSPDWNKVAALGAQPGSIDLARCSSHWAGPEPGRLPAFPGVGTPRGEWLFMWSWARHTTQHVGEARASGAQWLVSGGLFGDSESRSQQMSGSWRHSHSPREALDPRPLDCVVMTALEHFLCCDLGIFLLPTPRSSSLMLGKLRLSTHTISLSL